MALNTDEVYMTTKLAGKATFFLPFNKGYNLEAGNPPGKSNSITCAAYQLIETYPENMDVHVAKGMEQPLFDSVIVVTDRRLLDRQLRETIKEFPEVKNIIAPAYKSVELKNALEQGKKIIEENPLFDSKKAQKKLRAYP